MSQLNFVKTAITITRKDAEWIALYYENRDYGVFIVDAPSYSEDGQFMGDFSVFRTVEPELPF